MTRIEEDTMIPWFKEAALLSYKECEPESNDIMLYYDGEFKGMIEVWTDRSHKSRMKDGIAEYILLNHTMYYISDFEKCKKCETIVEHREIELKDGELITVPLNEHGLVPSSVHYALLEELKNVLEKKKKLEQAQGMLRAEFMLRGGLSED